MTVQNASDFHPLGRLGKKDEKKLGLYVHVPFCAKMCEFCAFYKESADRGKIDQYLEGLEAELAHFPPPAPVDTIFFGGGTPTLLATKDLERLCSAVRAAAGDRFVEWSVECAPSTVKEDKLLVMKALGVNRLSLGVQSFSARVLEAIGRPHTVKQTLEAIELIKKYSNNWNLDLIFAAADSALEEWTADLQTALSHKPSHISTYCLTFESDTALFIKMLKGSKKRPSPEEEAKFYLKTWEILRGAGYNHYELANFALPGHACQHNLNTWHMHDWVGYGPSAASQVQGHRYTHIGELSAWHQGVTNKHRKLTEESRLTPPQVALDALVFGLRLPGGVQVAPLEAYWDAKTRKCLQAAAGALRQEGLLRVEGNLWRLSDQGLLVADAVGTYLNEHLQQDTQPDTNAPCTSN